MQFCGSCYTIFTNTELAYDPPELSAWDKFWQSTTGKCLAAFLLGFASVVCIYTFGFTAFLATAGMMVGSLALCGAIAGYQSYVNGKGFWRGFERYINGNWALHVAIDSVFLLIACGIKLRSSHVQNAGSNQPLPNGNKEVSIQQFPPNNGAVEGTEKTIELKPGKYSRYGTIGEKSNYITDFGTDPNLLSLPPYNDRVHIEITVLEPISGVEQSIVAPWKPWGGIGGGTQYMLPKSLLELKQLGIIKF